MAQDELAAIEQNYHFAPLSSKVNVFHQTVQEKKRRARNAVSEAVLDSSARCEKALRMKKTVCAAEQRTGREDERTRNSTQIWERGSSALKASKHRK